MAYASSCTAGLVKTSAGPAALSLSLISIQPLLLLLLLLLLYCCCYYYYYFHIVRPWRASLESQVGVGPGFVQIRRLFSIHSELRHLQQVF